jgi:DNA helicase IV
MDWHVLLRRCPSHSITAVGDIAQRSAPAGARTWDDVLAPHLGSRWTYRTLTVNYRTPAEIMELAAAVLAEFAPDRRAPESVRETGEHPWQRSVAATDVRRAVEEEAARLERGTLAVIAADVGGLLDLPAEVHTPVSAKGLEFDVVVVVDPERIRAHNPADLYVSLTRATQRLGLLHVEH